MGLFDKKMQELTEKAGKQLEANMKALEKHQITIQENQCEQEAYLKDITERLKRIELKLK